MSTTKDKRMEVRVDHETEGQIKRAARVVREQPSEFIRKAAFERAEQILAQQLLTVMPADQFDQLLASLDEADEAPKLAKAAREQRAYTRS